MLMEPDIYIRRFITEEKGDSMKNTRKQTMTSIFHKWLLIFTIGAFLSAYFTTQYLHVKQSERQAQRALLAELKYVSEQITDFKNKEAQQNYFAKETLLGKAYAVGEILDKAPEILRSQSGVSELARLFSLAELDITDKTGLIIRSTDPALENTFRYSDHPETAVYMDLITGKKSDITEDPRLNAAGPSGEDQWMLYAGVPRSGRKGIIEIGYTDAQYDKIMSSVSITNFATNYDFMNTGCLFILDNGIDGNIISSTSGKDRGKTLAQAGITSVKPSERLPGALNLVFNGNKYIAYSEPCCGFLVIVMLPSGEIYKSGNTLMMWITLFYCILFALVYFMISGLLDRIVIRGFNETNNALTKIVDGNLGQKVDVATTSEFVSLSAGINTTVDALNKAITEAAHRMDKDLEFAHAIQTSALPTIFPPFPGYREFNIFATMNSAREVGGDFYDFFLIGNDRLGFVIADVSGKGIPAALFMMTSKTELKNCISSKPALKDAVSEANRTLCENNAAGMFVTAFTGILNFRTGELRYVNGGHNFPLIRHNGSYSWINNKSGLILGLFPDKGYIEYSVMMSPGDMIYLYTDGVTEAMNVQGELYGNDRLASCLNSLSVTDPEEVLAAVADNVQKYENGAQQADDITMLGLTYLGPDGIR